MDSGRLEAFSDGVLAIIITIMVLEMKAPEETTLEAFIPVIPIFVSYLISFIYVGTYWNNHHHLFQITEQVNGKVLWVNLLLLFCLSLVPFATSWIGENHIEPIPVAFYGIVLLMSGIAYGLLQKTIIQSHDDDHALKQMAGKNIKGNISFILYLIGIAFSFWEPWIGIACYVVVLCIWFIPDIRIEKSLKKEHE